MERHPHWYTEKDNAIYVGNYHVWKYKIYYSSNNIKNFIWNEYIKQNIFHIHASLISWDDFIAFRSSKVIRKLSQISKIFIASFFDFVPIARLKRKKEKKCIRDVLSTLYSCLSTRLINLDTKAFEQEIYSFHLSSPSSIFFKSLAFLGIILIINLWSGSFLFSICLCKRKC